MSIEITTASHILLSSIRLALEESYNTVPSVSSIQPFIGNNSASGYFSNVLGGQNNIADGGYSSVIGGHDNNSNNVSNVVILGSNITASLSDYTYVNNLSSQGDINISNGKFNTAGGNSDNWNDVYTSFNPASASWNAAYTSTLSAGLSTANWNNTFSTVQTLSYGWQQTTNNVAVSSLGWNSASTLVYTNSALWGTGGDPFNATLIAATSGNWDNVYTSVNALSDKWDSCYTAVNYLSGTWEYVINEFVQGSPSWNSVYTSVNNTSANWNSVYSLVNTTTATTFQVNSLSAKNNLTVENNLTVGNNVSANNYYGNAGQTVLTDGTNTTGNGLNTLTLNYQAGVYANTPLLTVTGTTSSTNVATLALSSRFINLVHSTPNDGINPALFIGERGDGSGGTIVNSLSGFNTTYDEVNNRLNISTQFGTVTSTAVTIANTGNVGIGISAPTSKLTVVGDISATGNVYGNSYINIQSGTTYILSNNDSGGVIGATNAATGLTASIIGTNYPIGFQTSIIQLGTARVTISAGFGVTLNQEDGYYRTLKQYSAATLVNTGATGWVLFGSLSS